MWSCKLHSNKVKHSNTLLPYLTQCALSHEQWVKESLVSCHQITSLFFTATPKSSSNCSMSNLKVGLFFPEKVSFLHLLLAFKNLKLFYELQCKSFFPTKCKMPKWYLQNCKYLSHWILELSYRRARSQSSEVLKKVRTKSNGQIFYPSSPWWLQFSLL